MKVSYEDVFIYLDLTKEILKKKEIAKAIKYYISEKNKININGHYGLLIFQEEGNPIFITDKKDSDIILNAIDENWKLRPKKKSYFENGLFYIFSYIAETVRKKSKYNRVIVITDTASDLSEDYTDALFNLVSKIKVFPTFIDIIRVSDKEERFFKDDVKLNILASDTKGGIFYIKDKAEFHNVFKKLVKSKQLINIFADKADKVKIKKEDYAFYSQLAKDLIDSPKELSAVQCFFCSDEICPVCTNINDIPKMCPECSTAFHHCCITNYAIQYNIGIPHIFRCPKCDVLLKIHQDEIVVPEDSSIKSAEDYIDWDTIEGPGAPEQLDNLPEIQYSTKLSSSSEEKSHTVRIGGYFGKVYMVKKVDNKLIYQKIKKNIAITGEIQEINVDTNIKNAYAGPLKKKPEIPITSCPECGTQLNTDLIKDNNICPFCGHKLA